MAPFAAVNHTPSLLMGVLMNQLSMDGRTKHAAKGKLRARKTRREETEIECYIAFVDVHVEVLVLVRPVLDDKGVMIAKRVPSPVLPLGGDTIETRDTIIFTTKESCPNTVHVAR